MTIRTILVPLDGINPVEDIMATALVVAQRFDSHISTIHVSENSLNAANYVTNLSKALKESVINEENNQLGEVAERINKELELFCAQRRLQITDNISNSNSVTVSWVHVHGEVNSTLINYSRLHDVTALYRPVKKRTVLRRGGQAMSFTETVMTQSGRPVLLVPPNWKTRKCKHAVVAWNQSLESSRAVAMTMPWLAQMERVSIVVAKSREASGQQLVKYLSRHDIKSEIEILNRKSNSAGKRLLYLCSEIDGDFLVMGAYGSARIEKYLFGGVTDHVLNNAEVITVMVH